VKNGKAFFILITVFQWGGAALQAQGKFVFSNWSPGWGIDAKVLDWNGAPLAGTNYFAQAYVGWSVDSLVPVGTPVHFRSDRAGYIHSTVVATPFRALDMVWAEMRVWASTYTSFEEAQAAGGPWGRSHPVQVHLSENPDGGLSYMKGLVSFALVPEPAPPALIPLAALGWWLSRRPKPT
jgi:hypothetical protein